MGIRLIWTMDCEFNHDEGKEKNALVYFWRDITIKQNHGRFFKYIRQSVIDVKADTKSLFTQKY